MNFTPAQAIAVKQHKKNVIVSAGAGSGKTHVLVERYLALLEANPTWHLNHIVAITFTRKAADEMRDRVRQKLEERYHDAVSKNNPLADHWALWLSEIDGAQIDTIHGLCANLLRANFAEAGLDPDFAVMDEIQATLLLEQAVQSVFIGLSEETPPAPELALFAQYGENTVRGVVSNANLLSADVTPIEDILTTYEQFVAIHTLYIQEKANALKVYEWHDDDERWRILIEQLGIMEATTDIDEQLSAIATIADIQFRKKLSDPTTKFILTEMRDIAKETGKAIQEAHTATLLNDLAQESENLWHSLINRVKNAYTDAK
ncbi:MAG TPA: UvrD-helicase domain-containing protein, partial [Aggregatilineales bacterium]|nr:UvrD-helicase domain-containing protein [Aggregatilineales bacterium]